ncbi:Fe-S cluster assembly protein SufD [Aliidiomarina minuta]|uniref:Fe-S cluster assembly protein SufD n=1 Tax=Aliidiomarina minuta TaxID=880057 RepID=A0A432W650_9GAMM|nr:Fe-S cluster assembly protein SufD [Aliidiomarina minuta]RUO25456.1 Fe-S cluster assembly protein SufD [Aliidiomarina minuta]
MSQWLAQVIDRAAAVDDWLSPVRAEALAQLRGEKWPGRRTEAWRYTSLHPVENLQLATSASSEQTQIAAIEGLNSLDIVFVDGQLQTDINNLELPAGVTITSLSDPSTASRTVAGQVFTQVKPQRHLFGLVNDVLAQQGVIIDLADDASLSQPVRIVNISGTGVESHNRVIVRLGARAKATIIEHGEGAASGFNTAFAEYLLGEQAELEHYRFSMYSAENIHIGGSHFQLGTRSKLNSTLVGYGSQLSRLDVDIHHAGEHAFAKFNNIYLLAAGEHFDLHSTIEHAVPNGTTEENARGIIGDRAKAVFNGRIHIHRDAQKTLAELNNRNLLLSRRAQINTKPELEIYADDVQCAHGATVAEIEEEALYYLRSRGIPRSQALVMLNFGFIQELVAQMPNQALVNWLQPLLKARFESMEVK